MPDVVRSSRVKAWGLALLLLRPSVAAVRLQAGGSGEPAVQHDVTVTLKLIQVYVSDKEGRPIADLGRSEFTVLDNGRPQVVTEFETHLAHPPARAAESAPEPAAPPRMTRKFFLLFDLAFNDMGGVSMAQEIARDFLDAHVRPDDEVGVLSYATGRGLRLHEYLTADHGRVRDAVLSVGSASALGRAGALFDEMTSERTAKMDGKAGGAMAAKARADAIRITGASQYRQDVQAFSKALADFAKAVRYIPGYKHIVLLSKGVPDFLMYQRADAVAPRMDTTNLGASDGLDLRLRFESMVRELASSDCPVLAVNMEGLAPRFKDVDFLDAVGAVRQPLDPTSFQDRTTKGDASLREMAKLSGGRYLGDSNDTGRIAEEIERLTGSFYVLGYVLDEARDGKFHKVEVRVGRPGAVVRVQQGYYGPKPFAKLSDLEKKLHLIDLALGGKTYLSDPRDLPMAALACPTRSGTEVVMLGKAVPELLPDGAGKGIEVVALAFDADRDVVGQARLELGRGEASRHPFLFALSVPAPPGTLECRLVMRDLATGASAVGTGRAAVPRRFEEGLRLFPPLLLVADGPAPILDAPDAASGGTGRLLASRYAFEPDGETPLLEGVSGRGTEITALLPASLSNFAPRDVLLSAHLMNLASGERLSLPLKVSDRRQREDTVFYKLTLRLERVPPARYALYIYAEEGATRQVYSFTNRTLAVK